jgi:tRNA pseudouridine13 synthase
MYARPARVGQRANYTSGWLRRFLLSAFPTEPFNTWLGQRIDRSWFCRLLAGDVAKKADTGGLFKVGDGARERSRFQRQQITFERNPKD